MGIMNNTDEIKAFFAGKAKGGRDMKFYEGGKKKIVISAKRGDAGWSPSG